MNTLYVVGFGPGKKEYMTEQAIAALEQAEVIVGYTTYVNLIKEYFPGKTYEVTAMRKEVERCQQAIDLAQAGRDVAMISSGDSGIYGMAGIIYQLAEGRDIRIEVVPGVTAASMAAAVLGAPLMHDFAVISLSDLMTPLDLIMKRVRCAAAADMIICLYNPKSKGRPDYLAQAACLILEEQKKDLPVGIVRNAGREGQEVQLTTLSAIEEATVDMLSIVIIGNSRTYVRHRRMITPRGYQL
ncbi:MAG: precorrin-3B C(17)-methyltransferase [Lachnospiraceae bacterium]|nr:precorrin-3B C(17)-methyltransferase [Lachnospiraceae bacterium]MDY5741707.1 precorrin-3B C(17)-methyltransferase [Lachnospiraceae bacterium]